MCINQDASAISRMQKNYYEIIIVFLCLNNKFQKADQVSRKGIYSPIKI